MYSALCTRVRLQSELGQAEEVFRQIVIFAGEQKGANSIYSVHKEPCTCVVDLQ